ncbi:DUF2889 domain-containing protein [Motiliproteus sp. SC1-56]|uniref:DUF2889 domain-containing protein n=1 Tax=Motiliproteus sp. SC1-56 TaxID=2799565 RepID=UPI001A8F78A8|nr:DUF2889 domain-containing protein [Motiliproteus sp. SC1-56]
MNLPAARRTLLHSRDVSCRGYVRNDGLWEIEGRMRDIKSFDMANEDRGRIAAGEPLHDITLTLTLDQQLLIHAVSAKIEAAPFATCPAITPAFQQLVGLRIVPGFRQQVKALLAGVKGCTHLVELLGPIATTAYQTLWQSASGYDGDSAAVREFLTDSCHSLAADGPVVQRYWQDKNQDRDAARPDANKEKEDEYERI